MDRAAWVEGRFNDRKAGEDYPRVFTGAHLKVAGGDRPGVVRHIRSMPIKEQMVAALDDWAYVAWVLEDTKLAEKLMAVARAVAPDPEWGDRLRQPRSWRNPQVLINLAEKAPAKGVSPQLLNLLGTLLPRKNPIKLTWLRKAQARFPADFWLNFDLALALRGTDLVEATGFYRVALALRPRSSAAWNNLGTSLLDLKKLPEAIDAFHQAIALNPKHVLAHYNLGNAFFRQHKLPEALATYRQAIALDNKDADVYHGLGNALYGQKKYAEATRAYRKATVLNPKHALAYYCLGLALTQQKKLPEAVVAYRQAIALAPKLARHYGALGYVLMYQRKFAEARKANQKALELLPAGNPMRRLAQRQLWMCNQLLAKEKRIARILQGMESAEPKELLSMALMCREFKHHATAVQLYRKAFQTQPELAEDEAKRHRYLGACCASLAGSGEGENARDLPTEERANLRHQALTWLQADLARYVKEVKGGNARTRKLVVKRLTQWQSDADLAGVREAKEVALSPETERQDWVKLWAEVRRVLKDAQGK
jgi:tetratricopeptide (TPR) repeat protein